MINTAKGGGVVLGTWRGVSRPVDDVYGKS